MSGKNICSASHKIFVSINTLSSTSVGLKGGALTVLRPLAEEEAVAAFGGARQNVQGGLRRCLDIQRAPRDPRDPRTQWDPNGPQRHSGNKNKKIG